jgi:hypothetical protein
MRGNLLAGPAVLAVLVALAGCHFGGRPAPPVVLAAGQVESGIQQGETDWNADLAARDPAKVAARYAETGWLMAPGFTAPAQGRAAILKVMTQLLADPNFSLSFHDDRTKASIGGNEAYSQGVFTETVSGPRPGSKFSFTGTYLRIYRAEGGATPPGEAPGTGPGAVWNVVEDISAADPQPVPTPAGGAS